jgi:hypothetical protein
VTAVLIMRAKENHPVKLITLTAVIALASFGVGACGGSNADTVSENIAKEAEKFHVGRRIIVTNNITDKVEFEVVGRCSFEEVGRRLDVVCKDAPRKYTKASIGLGDNNTWASVQLGEINVSEYRTKIIIRPTSIVPDLDLVTGTGS